MNAPIREQIYVNGVMSKAWVRYFHAINASVAGESGEVYPETYGAKGDGTTDDTAAINAALAATDGWVQFGPKTYLVSATKSDTFAGANPIIYCLQAKSNMLLRGVRGSTVIKLADSQSTEASPKESSIIFGSGIYSNHDIRDIIFDLNGENNRISTVTARQKSTAYFIGSPGNDGYIDGLSITGCRFINAAGTNQLILNIHTNGTAGALSKNVYIANNVFYNNGLYATDYSSIYAMAENVRCENNLFEQPSALSKTSRNWTAFEVHGANTWFINNHVKNYYRGCWVASNFTNPVSNVWVSRNIFDVWGCGPSMWRNLSTVTAMSDIHITDNFITLDATNVANLTKAGVEFSTPYSVSDVEISRNHIVSSMQAVGLSVGILITGPASADTGTPSTQDEVIDNIRITGNYAEGVTHGELVRTFATRANITNVISKHNTYKPIVYSGGTIAVGSYFINWTASTYTNLMTGIILDNNNYLPETAPAGGTTAYGIRMENSFGEIEASNNRFNSNLTASPANTGKSVLVTGVYTRMRGNDFTEKTTAPVRGVWEKGDQVANSAPASGATPRWVCTTGGGAVSATRADETAYTFGTWVTWSTGTTVWQCTVAGTSTTGAPDITGKVVGDTIEDGGVTWTLMSLTTAVFKAEANLA